jgi:hypothetical protein
MILINKLNREKEEQKRFVILSKYNIFFKNMQSVIMDMYPGIKNKERMGKIGIEWRKHKMIISNLNDKYVEEINWVLK